MESKYIMDANVFITAHRQMYPFDVAPGFWKQLVDKAADKILIIEEVQNEILRGKDLLADWYSILSFKCSISHPWLTLRHPQFQGTPQSPASPPYKVSPIP